MTVLLPVRPSMVARMVGVAELHLGVVDHRLLHRELRLRAFDRGLVGFDRRRRSHRRRRATARPRPSTRGRGDELRLAVGCDLLIFGVGAVARELRFGLVEQRLIADEIGLGLLQRRLERPRIDHEELVALLDDVAFVEERLLQLAGDLRADRNGGVRLDVADGRDVDRHVLLRDLGRDHRLRAAAAAAAAAASATAAAAAAPELGSRCWAGGKREPTRTPKAKESRTPRRRGRFTLVKKLIIN